MPTYSKKRRRLWRCRNSFQRESSNKLKTIKRPAKLNEQRLSHSPALYPLMTSRRCMNALSNRVQILHGARRPSKLRFIRKISQQSTEQPQAAISNSIWWQKKRTCGWALLVFSERTMLKAKSVSVRLTSALARIIPPTSNRIYHFSHRR